PWHFTQWAVRTGSTSFSNWGVAATWPRAGAARPARTTRTIRRRRRSIISSSATAVRRVGTAGSVGEKHGKAGMLGQNYILPVPAVASRGRSAHTRGAVALLRSVRWPTTAETAVAHGGGT